MLDAILGSHRRVDVDWLHVQRALNRGLTGFLAVWTHVVLWVPPFVIAGYGASPDAFRALAVAFLVGVAWLAWIIRSVFGRDQLAWRSSLLAWIGLALGAVVLAVFALHPMSRFNIFLNTGPVAWFSLVGFVLLLSQERSALARLRGKAGIVLVGLYAVASMYPAVLSYIGGSVNMAPVSVSVERYVQYGLSQYGPWGAGLGRASEGFWSLAELVDVEQIPGAPRLASAYIGMLWEGGAGLLASFLVFVIVPAVYALAASRRALRRLGPASSERKRELRRRWWAFGLVAWLVALVFLPHSFMGILAAGLLVSMALLVPDSASEVHRPHILPLTTRLRLIPARILAVILAVLVVYGAISAARLLAFPQPPDISAGAPSLSGFDHWAIARTLGSQADRTSNPGAVLAQAAAFYQAALPRLPRNLILRLEASQFHRMVMDGPDEAARIAEQGLVVDGTYIPLVLERALQLAQAGQNEQALALLLPHVSESASVAYQAGKLSLEAGNAEQAVLYYESAIQQNPNHLQARFDLTQAFAALGRTQDATLQLDELSSRVAEDDFQTHAAIDALRGLVK